MGQAGGGEGGQVPEGDCGGHEMEGGGGAQDGTFQAQPGIWVPVLLKTGGLRTLVLEGRSSVPVTVVAGNELVAVGFGPGQSRTHRGCRGCRAGEGRLFQAREQSEGGFGQ